MLRGDASVEWNNTVDQMVFIFFHSWVSGQCDRLFEWGRKKIKHFLFLAAGGNRGKWCRCFAISSFRCILQSPARLSRFPSTWLERKQNEKKKNKSKVVGLVQFWDKWVWRERRKGIGTRVVIVWRRTPSRNFTHVLLGPASEKLQKFH